MFEKDDVADVGQRVEAMPTMTRVTRRAVGPPSTTPENVYNWTALFAWNAAERGDSDVLPWSREFGVLRGYTREAAEAAWRSPSPPSVEVVEVPLSRLTSRDAHLVDALSSLRLSGAVLSIADIIERHRAPASVATAVRFAPNRSRARLIMPGSFERWEEGLSRIEARFPRILELDCALFFPSSGDDVVHPALARWSPAGADLVREELRRLGLPGLPVGGIPARLLGEAILHDVDVALADAGREHVRKMDDLRVGVQDERDGEEVRRLVASVLRPHLHLNKAKTKVRPSSRDPEEHDPAGTIRLLLKQSDPDRVKLGGALYKIRDDVPGWDGRRRRRWVRDLLEAVDRIPVSVGPLLRTVERLLPGTPGIDDGGLQHVRALLHSRVALHRAEATRFLSRHDPDAVPHLVRVAVSDASALARREALLGLARAGAPQEVAGVLRGEPQTDLDRGAWVMAAGVVGCGVPFELTTPYVELLHRAAREHVPRDL